MATATEHNPYARTHARKVNAKFDSNKANYVSWQARWNEALAKFPLEQKHQIISRLKAALKRFERKYPNIKSFQDQKFRLCKALTKKLTNILIDTTIQRELDVDWVIKIIEDFRSYQAQPLQVYRPMEEDLPQVNDPDNTWACWEGQHTGMALYLIGTMVFGLGVEEIEIPTAEYDFANRVECRRTFMANNSKDGRKVLEPIDIIVQKIFAVRLDGADEPEWQTINEKQNQLQAADLFMTHSKFHDHHEAGAITRPGDLCDDKYSVELIRKFTVYAQAVLSTTPRAIDTKELPIICGFLKMAEQSNIDYTDDQIQSLAYLCMNLFDANFHEDGPFWNQVCKAYTHWHEAYYEDMDEASRPGIKLNKDWSQGGTFFYWQLKKSWFDDEGNHMPLPKLNISTAFRPQGRDLW